MHAVHGLTLANVRTNEHLKEFQEQVTENGTAGFLALDECILREYAGNQPVIVTPADLVYSGEMLLDLGNCQVRAFQAQSPHTDDATLVFAPSEKALFLGDSISGTFPTWEKNPKLCKMLAETLAPMDAELCLGSHWEPMTKQEVVGNLLKKELL